jgi:hypothetical protein
MLGHLFPAIAKRTGFEDKTNQSKKLKIHPSPFALEAPVIALSAASVLFFADRLVPLTMPQTTETFQPPFSAIGFLLDHWQTGNVFNRLQIGSILDMYGPPNLKIFADTRIDVFGDKILNDYIQILSARGNYKSLLDSYQIHWVIVSSKDAIAPALAQDSGWRQEFVDKDCVIFHRGSP